MLRQLLREVLREDAQPQPLLVDTPPAGLEGQLLRARARVRMRARVLNPN